MQHRAARLQGRERERAGEVAELRYVTRSLTVAALNGLSDVSAYSHYLQSGFAEYGGKEV